MSKEKIFFSKGMALLGILSGLTIALGLPYLILVYGEHFSPAYQLSIIRQAAFGGGIIVLVSAFFGIVIPAKVCDNSSPEVNITNTPEKKTVEISSRREGNQENTESHSDSPPA